MNPDSGGARIVVAVSKASKYPGRKVCVKSCSYPIYSTLLVIRIQVYTDIQLYTVTAVLCQANLA